MTTHDLRPTPALAQFLRWDSRCVAHLGAAHTLLPFGTWLASKNDRGSGNAGTILVPTDLSPAAKRAALAAATLAKLRGGAVKLLHVFEPPNVTIPELALDPRLEQGLLDRASKQLAADAEELRARGVSVETSLEIGSPPASIIAAAAEDARVGMVAIGSRGRRAASRLLLGSVAEASLAKIGKPVLVVPTEGHADRLVEGVESALPPARRWRIAVGLDRSESSHAAVDWVRELRRLLPCDVAFIHLYWPVAEYTRLGLTGPRDLFQPDQTTVHALERSFADVVGDLPGEGEAKVHVMPHWGAIGDRLAEEAARLGADLLVMGTHHRHGLSRLWHGSTVLPALHTNRIPVMCVSRPARSSPADARPDRIPTLRTILAATDLSDHANASIAHAFALARGSGGTVHLVYVHERPLPQPAYAFAPSPEGRLAPAEKRALREHMHALIPTEASALGIASDVTIVDGGDAAETICQLAARLNADAICIGSHGRSGLGRALLGSVASHVVQKADRPVFVARHPVD